MEDLKYFSFFDFSMVEHLVQLHNIDLELKEIACKSETNKVRQVLMLIAFSSLYQSLCNKDSSLANKIKYFVLLLKNKKINQKT